jgi:hypothetical protein
MAYDALMSIYNKNCSNEQKFIIEHYRKAKTIKWRNDTQHNDTPHNDIQHNDTPHNDIQHNDTPHNDIQHNDTQHNITK